MDSHTVQIITIAAIWLLFMSAIRFTAASAVQMSPLGTAAYRIVRFGMTGRQARREWINAFDAIFMSVNIALFKPWALAMLLGGMALMGIGFLTSASGDIAMIVSPGQFYALTFLDRYLDWLTTATGCLGMAGGMAAVSPKPTTSALISFGFTVAGIGIGVVASLYF